MELYASYTYFLRWERMSAKQTWGVDLPVSYVGDTRGQRDFWNRVGFQKKQGSFVELFS